MQKYFEALLPAEELEQLKYIPTIPEFVEWIESETDCRPTFPT